MQGNAMYMDLRIGCLVSPGSWPQMDMVYGLIGTTTASGVTNGAGSLSLAPGKLLAKESHIPGWSDAATKLSIPGV
jgi:hypothetical protein